MPVTWRGLGHSSCSAAAMLDLQEQLVPFRTMQAAVTRKDAATLMPAADAARRARLDARRGAQGQGQSLLSDQRHHRRAGWSARHSVLDSVLVSGSNQWLPACK